MQGRRPKASLLAAAAILSFVVAGANFSEPLAAEVLYPQQQYPMKGADFHCADYSGSPPQPIYSDRQRDTALDHMAAAGAAVIRVIVSWPRMEDTGGYLDTVSTCVGKITARGMSAILTIVGTPPSAQSGYTRANVNTRRPPSDCLSAGDRCSSIRRATSELTSALLTKGQSPYSFSIEIWNEPNNRSFWKPVCNSAGDIVDPNDRSAGGGVCPDGEPESEKAHLQYARLLKAAYQGVRLGSPAVPVTVVGGSALKAGYVRMDDWVRDLYEDGAEEYFDVLSLHPYPNYGMDGACLHTSTTFGGAHGVQAVVNVMASHSDSSKPIWLTESGWSDARDSKGAWLYCKESDQRTMLSTAATYAALPHDVVVEIWWLTDRKPMNLNLLCPGPDWRCGTNLLNDDLSVPTSSPNIYTAFRNAPQG